MNNHLKVVRYRVYISCCVPRKRGSKASVMEMENQVKIIRASLQGAQIATRSVDADAFMQDERLSGEHITDRRELTEGMTFTPGSTLIVDQGRS